MPDAQHGRAEPSFETILTRCRYHLGRAAITLLMRHDVDEARVERDTAARYAKQLRRLNDVTAMMSDQRDRLIAEGQWITSLIDGSPPEEQNEAGQMPPSQWEPTADRLGCTRRTAGGTLIVHAQFRDGGAETVWRTGFQQDGADTVWDPEEHATELDAQQAADANRAAIVDPESPPE